MTWMEYGQRLGTALLMGRRCRTRCAVILVSLALTACAQEPAHTPQTPPDQASQIPPDQASQTPPDQASQTPPDQTPQTPPDQASQTPPDQASQTPPDQTPQTPPDQTPQTPPDQASQTPPDQTPQTPPDQTPQTPPDQTPQTPPDQTPQTPPDQASQTPPDQTPQTPPDQTPQTPPDQASQTPPDQTPQTPPDQTPQTPPDQAPQTPPDQTPQTPPDQASQTPPDQAPQTPPPPESQLPAASERWNLFYQAATSIGKHHGTFRSPYEGPFSLQDTMERDASLTTTLFFGLRLEQNTLLYFDPEIAGGRGFSGVNGLANSSNGELPRVASATPKPYLARLYISHDFALGQETESVEGDENQLAGQRPVNRYTITAGRFTLTDFFDNNGYSHDPRTQFMGWAVMYNGAWDYPADVRGYTWGWVHEVHTHNWSFRYASAAMPRVANGLRFDRRLFRNRGDVVEAERRWEIGKHSGTVRLLHYENRANAGNYAESFAASRGQRYRAGRDGNAAQWNLKYGFGMSAEQELTDQVGVFARLGWNDGKTESFAFTAIDRLATGGVSIKGKRWRRPLDTVATEVTAAGISGVHALYLASGGHDFLIGDGRLQYGPETIWESYYNAHVLSWLSASIDLQHVTNPAYNEDRGPVWIPSLRLHVEFGKSGGNRKH